MTLYELLEVVAFVVAFFLIVGTLLGYIDWRP